MFKCMSAFVVVIGLGSTANAIDLDDAALSQCRLGAMSVPDNKGFDYVRLCMRGKGYWYLYDVAKPSAQSRYKGYCEAKIGDYRHDPLGTAIICFFPPIRR